MPHVWRHRKARVWLFVAFVLGLIRAKVEWRERKKVCRDVMSDEKHFEEKVQCVVVEITWEKDDASCESWGRLLAKKKSKFSLSVSLRFLFMTLSPPNGFFLLSKRRANKWKFEQRTWGNRFAHSTSLQFSLSLRSIPPHESLRCLLFIRFSPSEKSFSFSSILNKHSCRSRAPAPVQDFHEEPSNINRCPSCLRSIEANAVES